MERKVGLWLGAVAVVTLIAGGQASAHHSFSMFDRQKEVVLKGTIKAFQWTNPHSYIELAVPGPDGQIQPYSIEMNSPNNLSRQGWRSTTLKAGDKVTVTINPLRDGTRGGLFITVQTSDGRTLGGPATEALNARAG